MNQRLISLVVSLFILAAAYISEGVQGMVFLVAVVPLLCFIWFGALVGSITNFGGLRHPVVNKETPGCFIAGIAWVFLIALAGVMAVKII